MQKYTIIKMHENISELLDDVGQAPFVTISLDI